MSPNLNSSRRAESEDQQPTSLPAHVNTLKDGLLDFNHFLGLEATMLVLGDDNFGGGDQMDAIPLSAYKTDSMKESQWARDKEILQNAQELAKGAWRLANGVAQDGEWRELFRATITARMEDLQDSRSVKSIKRFMNRWEF